MKLYYIIKLEEFEEIIKKMSLQKKKNFETTPFSADQNLSKFELKINFWLVLPFFELIRFLKRLTTFKEVGSPWTKRKIYFDS